MRLDIGIRVGVYTMSLDIGIHCIDTALYFLLRAALRLRDTDFFAVFLFLIFEIFFLLDF